VSAFLVVAVSALAGLRIIEFFGISVASFQVGGGLLLLMSSINMLNAQQAESRGSDVGDGQAKADSGDSIAVVPVQSLQLARAQFDHLADGFAKRGDVVSQTICEIGARALDKALADSEPGDSSLPPLPSI